MTPTIRQVIRCYALVAAAERIKCGRPGGAAARNAIGGTRRLCRAAGDGEAAHQDKDSAARTCFRALPAASSKRPYHGRLGGAIARTVAAARRGQMPRPP